MTRKPTAGVHPKSVENVIAIFDSGVGGLTVLRAVRNLLPAEPIVYLGDSARIPYGTKGDATVKRFAAEDARFLMRFKPKLIIVACNTASAVAVDHVSAEVPGPGFGVVRPGAETACRVSATGRIGVMATETTVRSGAYQRHIMAGRPGAQVVAVPCPLLVPIIEDGRARADAIARLATGEYVGELTRHAVDTILLGCTHYPLLTDLIAEMAGPGVTIVDSAGETAKTVAEAMTKRGLRSDSRDRGRVYFLATDHPQRFAAVGGRFLGQSIKKVYWVEPEEFFGEK